MKKILISIIIMCQMTTMCVAQNVTSHNFEVLKHLDIFNAMYKNLDMMFVDTLNAEKVIGTAINSMLSQMDPYTEYFPNENAYKKGMTGAYAGIGATIHYSFSRKTVVIDEPFDDSPAMKAGLKKGDEILAVDKEKMEGKEVSYVSSHLRGEAGTTFLLKIRRNGKTMKIKITRASIKQIQTIPYYGMIGDDIGYVYLTSFLDGGCAKEVRRSFVELKNKGAKSFILDLRNNGGGLINEAVDIVNIFIPKGTKIVETRGKMERLFSSYSTTLEPLDTVSPLVVMVNNSSASASEIVAGALQDLDRAVIIGQRTFGKGLVQRSVDLPFESTLKLTIGKYYIPSGRCIQELKYNRSAKDKFEKDEIPDSLTHAFKTRNGREVRDGRGIMPDIRITPDTISHLSFYLSQIVDSTDTYFDWVCAYCNNHSSIASPSEFEITDEDFEDFKQKCISNGFKYDRISNEILKQLKEAARKEGYYDEMQAEFEALKKKLNHNISDDIDKHKDEIKTLLGADIVTYFYQRKGAIEYSLKHDVDAKEAQKILRDEKKYRNVLFTPAQM